MAHVVFRENFMNVKDQIRKIFPRASLVGVNLRRKPDHKIEAKIEVKVPRKRIVAVKSDENIKKAVDKSLLAVKKQLKKVKAKL